MGCGNIGSRHLQALSTLPFEADIEIIEPNEDAQNLAKNRLEEIEYDESQFTFSWKSSMINSKNNDLVILATPSKNRLDLVQTLVELGNKRFIIEKMVCQSKRDYELILQLINSTGSKAWVNASRRYFTSYQQIMEKLEENSNTNLCINAGNMGLGSNAIHFLDLFSWLVKNDNITLNGDFLDREILKNKRGDAYKEFSGMIIGKSTDSSTITINFSRDDSLPLCVNFFGNKIRLIVDETNKTVLDLNNRLQTEFKVEFQSTLTAKIVQDIFAKDSSLLPTLEESKNIHFELFRIFNEHIKRTTNCEVEKCPIT